MLYTLATILIVLWLLGLITGTVIGGLFAFTIVYTKRTQIWSLSSDPDPGQRSGEEGGATPPLPPHP